MTHEDLLPPELDTPIFAQDSIILLSHPCEHGVLVWLVREWLDLPQSRRLLRPEGLGGAGEELMEPGERAL